MNNRPDKMTNEPMARIASKKRTGLRALMAAPLLIAISRAGRPCPGVLRRTGPGPVRHRPGEKQQSRSGKLPR